MKCKCGMCPVQGFSACSTPYLKKMGNTLSEVFCSVGKADCKDLDLSKACICIGCKVHEVFNLASGSPVEHFCFNGQAK